MLKFLTPVTRPGNRLTVQRLQPLRLKPVEKKDQSILQPLKKY
jgi:hypothetical protein